MVSVVWGSVSVIKYQAIFSAVCMWMDGGDWSVCGECVTAVKKKTERHSPQLLVMK